LKQSANSKTKVLSILNTSKERLNHKATRHCSQKARGWIELSSVLRPRQHSIGYTGDGCYRSKDPTNSIKVLKAYTDYTINRKAQ